MSTHWGYDQIMVHAAVNYCLGRRTYITGICADWLIEQWPNLSESTKSLVKRDVEAAFERDDRVRESPCDRSVYPLGDNCDREQWERVRKLWAHL